MTEKLNMDDVDNIEPIEEDEFLSFSPIEADDESEAEYPQYDTGRDDKSYGEKEYTAGGKTLVMYHDEFGTLWSFKFRSGGELPGSLQGKFTDEAQADLAAQLYISSKAQG